MAPRKNLSILINGKRWKLSSIYLNDIFNFSNLLWGIFHRGIVLIIRVSELPFIVCAPGPYDSFGIKSQHMGSAARYFRNWCRYSKIHLSDVNILILGCSRWGLTFFLMLMNLPTKTVRKSSPRKNSTVSCQHEAIQRGKRHLRHKALGRVCLLPIYFDKPLSDLPCLLSIIPLSSIFALEIGGKYLLVSPIALNSLNIDLTKLIGGI